MNLRDAALEREYGLLTDPQRILNKLLHDYDQYLSLRRIPDGDPAFAVGMAMTPPHVFGVWEETSTASTKWAFTLSEQEIALNPGAVLARIVMGDASKFTPKQRIEKLQAATKAAELARDAYWAEKRAERREEMLFIASNGKSRIRHKINGEDMIVGDTLRPVRHHV